MLNGPSSAFPVGAQESPLPCSVPPVAASYQFTVGVPPSAQTSHVAVRFEAVPFTQTEEPVVAEGASGNTRSKVPVTSAQAGQPGCTTAYSTVKSL